MSDLQTQVGREHPTLGLGIPLISFSILETFDTNSSHGNILWDLPSDQGNGTLQCHSSVGIYFLHPTVVLVRIGPVRSEILTFFI